MGGPMVRPKQQRRRAYWRRLAGTDELPVKYPRPRWQAIRPGWPDTLAYDLDPSRLHPAQRERLAWGLTQIAGGGEKEWRARLDAGEGIPIRASQLDLLFD